MKIHEPIRLGHRCGAICLTTIIFATVSGRVQAGAPRALPAGQTPADSRLDSLKTLNAYFPFRPSSSPEAWTRRAEEVRRQLLVATGLWPMPTKTPLKTIIHGKLDCGDYTIEKVYFQSYPGHFVTGNLYRPAGVSGKRPGVLSPHGHWSNGRFHDMGKGNLKCAPPVIFMPPVEMVDGRESGRYFCVDFPRTPIRNSPRTSRWMIFS